MEKIMITACICGAEVTKEQNPAVPYSVQETAMQAYGAYQAGAAIIHLHVRTDYGIPTQDRKRYKQVIEAIRSLCPDVIIQVSTGGSTSMSFDERMQPLLLCPEMASLDCGTCNFGYDDIFINTEKMITDFAVYMKQHNIRPEVEIFDKGMMDTAYRLKRKGVLCGSIHFNFMLGIQGGMDASPENLNFLIRNLEQGDTFTVSATGRNEFPMIREAALHHGHVRVGLEDNLYLEKGILASSNQALVQKAVSLLKSCNREIASPEQARKILHLKEAAL